MVDFDLPRADDIGHYGQMTPWHPDVRTKTQYAADLGNVTTVIAPRRFGPPELCIAIQIDAGQ